MDDLPLLGASQGRLDTFLKREVLIWFLGAILQSGYQTQTP